MNNNKRNNVPISIIPQTVLESIAEECDDHVTKVIKAIRQLPPQHSAIISMIYFANLTHKQVASLLQIPPGSVFKKNKFSLEFIKKTVLPGS